MKRPLYTVSCNDLGSVSQIAEVQISAALSLATKWNAIVLMDEADVFMAERSLNDLPRNEMVSGTRFLPRASTELTRLVLLRVLEYFEGILFLTTNRAETIDPAFRSRIHFTLAYPSLTVEARRGLWRVFVSLGSAHQTPAWADSDFLDQVAEHQLNGRQIKNIVRVAFALANDKNREMLPADILLVLRASTSVENSQQ
jgi:SpoVK/Ycf46/Vps4 family AAA+-type ATPase